MNTQDDILSFMDLLDLDEEIIDSRLRTIMEKNSYTNKHLKSALNLLKYKNLINLHEDSECENEEEYTFIVKILADVHKENIDYVCKIVNIVLSLSKSTVVSKSEHLIQQILSNIELQQSRGSYEGTYEEEISAKDLLNLKLCDSILDAILLNNEKLNLPFLDIPLENVLASPDDKLKNYFLNNTVPKIVEAVNGYNILDRVWNYVKQLGSGSYDMALKILSCLSEFYLPVPDKEGKIKFVSEIVCDYKFWNILLDGLMSDDPAPRKISVYLIKRSIDTIMVYKKDILISSETQTIFRWTQKDRKNLKENWNNFFILMDSLEEKQSNIVLPSLQLFETIKNINSCWINCAYNIGLKHDNTQIRLKCIEQRLRANIHSLSDAIVVLEALNDINLYDCPNDCEELKNRILKAFEDKDTLVSILKALPKVKWSPVPLYNVTKAIGEIDVDLSTTVNDATLFQIVTDMLKIPCNSLTIRHAVKIDITYFIGHCCKKFNWRDYSNIYNLLEWDKYTSEGIDKNPFITRIKTLNLDSNDKQDFFKTICSTYGNIDIGLVYLKNNSDELIVFMEHVYKKIKNMQDVNNRQYANKEECFNDVVFITQLFNKTKDRDGLTDINIILSKEYNTVTKYIHSLVQSSEINLSIDEISILFKGYESMTVIKDDTVVKDLLEMYRQMIIVLTNKNVILKRKLYALFVVLIVTKKLYSSDKHRIFNLKQILHAMKHAKIMETTNANDTGRLRNAFYEKSCEVISIYVVTDEWNLIEADDSEREDLETADKICTMEEGRKEEVKENLKDLVDYVESVIECGGYGCLKWILRMMKEILPELLDDENINFNIVQFIDRMWKEIEELKSNNQYSPCIREFVSLIIQNCLLKKAMYNNVIVLYCSKIVEYGSLKNAPLDFLVNELSNIKINEHMGQIIPVLSDILLFSPGPKKEHRITDNTVQHILQHSKYCLEWNTVEVCFNFEIQLLAVSVLCGINNAEILETIASLIIRKTEDHLKIKQRYHGNSQTHRQLLIGLQHLLFLSLLNQRTMTSENILLWLINMLGKLPHQPSVRFCLEWCIALRIYVKNTQLNQKIVDMMEKNNVPIISQFMILYSTLKHKISIGVYNQEEYEYVLDFLLSHTMGQMFNIRLHAQYLATEIFKKAKINPEKYAYIIEVVQKTFVESAKDKNFVKLQEDYFINNFDIVEHLTPMFIYYFLPRYCEIGSNEDVSENFMGIVFKIINRLVLKLDTKTDLKKEWNKIKRPDEEILASALQRKSNNSKRLENSDTMGTIQKKYIPWKSMSEVNVFESGKKMETSGELIVVASLIDKLPNLGGMARTSEVFGVKTYVVDSLRHLQDRTFQGLSVSAERWVNIEEVRPGQSLKEYLMRMKSEGYSVVAAEQTSTSVQLQKFKFPKKTLLLLGHEKEGIPCDLLPMMDHCVEIPQQGFVRSLNVHVTAAIFVWEYSRQNIL